jgi:hypothetical protein
VRLTPGGAALPANPAERRSLRGSANQLAGDGKSRRQDPVRAEQNINSQPRLPARGQEGTSGAPQIQSERLQERQRQELHPRHNVARVFVEQDSVVVRFTTLRASAEAERISRRVIEVSGG